MSRLSVAVLEVEAREPEEMRSSPAGVIANRFRGVEANLVEDSGEGVTFTILMHQLAPLALPFQAPGGLTRVSAVGSAAALKTGPDKGGRLQHRDTALKQTPTRAAS